MDFAYDPAADPVATLRKMARPDAPALDLLRFVNGWVAEYGRVYESGDEEAAARMRSQLERCEMAVSNACTLWVGLMRAGVQRAHSSARS